MKSHTPLHQQDTEASRRRSGQRMSMGSSLPLPRTQSRIATARANQPAFDFMTGAERPPSRDRFRRSSVARPPSAHGNNEASHESEFEREKRRKELDEAKAEIKSLKYTIDNHKQEEQLATLRHESELRDARRKGEEDFQKMQAADSERSKAVRQYEALLKEFNEAKDSASNGKATLERRLRDSEESKRLLEEETEDFRSEKEETIRSLERRAAELGTRNETLQQSVEDLQLDSDRREALLLETQQELATRETLIGQLEGEVLKLKSQVGDVEVAQKVKQEMHEQLAHVRKLEEANRTQAAELKHFKQLHKAIEVVEEEKRSLQRRLEAKEGLETELGEARIQRQRLEDERLAWTAYLQSQAGADGQLEFDSPEALARAFVAEQIQIATLTERVGAVEAESSEKDDIVQTLEAEKSRLKEEIEKAKASSSAANASSTSVSSAKLVQRLERQKALANKEVQYLRDQLKVYDSEDATFQADQLDEAKQKRIQELEKVVDQYRTEVQTLTTELTNLLTTIETSKTQSQPQAPSQIDPQTGSKRSFSSSTAAAEESEQLGQLARKNRKLQDEYTKLKSTHKLLEKELSVTKERLSAAAKESKTRVLSLRSNPTSDFEAIKLSTLKALRNENEDLLAQIKNHFQSTPTTATIPLSTLSSAEHKIADLRTQLQSQATRNDRLLKTWGTKTSEFRQSIVDLLGWDVQFLKDGKMKVTSRFFPATEDAENSILFDGVRGSMKVSGGPQSAFAGRIGDQIKFWVKGKSCVPGLLAALTMEFWEEANRDGTVVVDV